MTRSSADDKDEARPKIGSCVVCGKSQVFEFRPFCSLRCKDVDLNRWLGGRYAISVSADETEE